MQSEMFNKVSTFVLCFSIFLKLKNSRSFVKHKEDLQLKRYEVF